MHPSPTNGECDYVVVGSGPGGGTLAARLAEAGHKVVLLEAGGDPRELSGGDPLQPNGNRLPADYDVPAFHGFASENEAMRWDFIVRHYSDDRLQQLDSKYCNQCDGRKADGILYPRAGALGGCSSHNAQILVYPSDSDWKYISDLTGDHSWEPANMRRYFERLENCRHRRLHRWLSRIGLNPSRHGWKGWLQTEKAIPMEVLADKNLFETIAESAEACLLSSEHIVQRLGWFLESWGDPNDGRLSAEKTAGVRYLPLTTADHARRGSRERVLEVAKATGRLEVRTHSLASKVILDERNRAVGVEYLHGANLYRACPNPSQDGGEPRRVYARNEVILAGGAFNTPQLLMLSGIGPSDLLERHGIEVRVELPGVGKNLQDRYEIAVVNQMSFPKWKMYEGVTFSPSDRQYQQWATCRSGIYATNGALLSVFKRSPVAGHVPDLFCMALLTDFRGYSPGYCKKFPESLNHLTWVVLKAHTRNCSGEVTLSSADPRDMPNINFRYFEQGGEKDLAAILDGIRFVRSLTAGLRERGMMKEICPGSDCSDQKQLESYVRQNAWGHHASCTCAIGAVEKKGVLDSNFRVHGTSGLRVVDASVFPRIPGVFIVSAVYMIAEKAADVILRGM